MPLPVVGREAELVHDGAEAVHDHGGGALRLPDGEAAEGHRRTGHGVGMDGVHLGHVLDARRAQGRLHVLLPRRVDLRQDDVL
eukprot:8050678-Pyramimonas_sp.AAC.2